MAIIPTSVYQTMLHGTAPCNEKTSEPAKFSKEDFDRAIDAAMENALRKITSKTSAEVSDSGDGLREVIRTALAVLAPRNPTADRLNWIQGRIDTLRAELSGVNDRLASVLISRQAETDLRKRRAELEEEITFLRSKL